MATNTPARQTVFEVTEYMVVLRQLERRDFGGTQVQIRGLIRCHGAEYTLDIMLIEPGTAAPQPIIDEASKKGTMFVPVNEAPIFIDILRNEKPIYAHLRTDNPEWTSITTTREPVGEGEDAMQRG